jgi:hypothetical protein
VDEISQAALAANADTELSVFGIATDAAFLLGMGFSPHVGLPDKKGWQEDRTPLDRFQERLRH